MLGRLYTRDADIITLYKNNGDISDCRTIVASPSSVLLENHLAVRVVLKAPQAIAES